MNGNVQRMTREQIVLAALASSNGATHTPVQVQKLLFLIDKQIPLAVHGPHFNFEPYDYGPFDSQVYDTLDHLNSEGLIETEFSANLRWKKYRTTEAGLEQGNRILGQLDTNTAEYIRELSSWVRGLSFADLVSSIYNAYPEMKVNSIFQG
jgi:uncharacterized phage-associated protein